MNIFQNTQSGATKPGFLKHSSFLGLLLSRDRISRCSPSLLFLLLIATIFIANFFINYLHDFLPNLHLWQHALIDSMVLSTIILPPIHYFWFGPLWRQIQERKKAEEDIARLSRKLISATEKERKKLALELHDECSQRITALQFGIESLLFLHPQHDQERQEKLAGLNGLVQQLSDLIRNFSSSLRSDMLEDLGLVSTLDWYVAEISRTVPGLKVDFEAVGLRKRLPSRIELILYRVCQESLTNVLKHARADHVQIMLTYSHPKVMLSIRDNGVGFNPAHADDGKRCLGLLGMRERVASVGGEWNVSSSREGGTLVRVDLPVSR